jgi:hypothetical protein
MSRECDVDPSTTVDTTTGAYLAPPVQGQWISLNAAAGVGVTDLFLQVYSTW